MAIPEKKKIEALRRAVRYLLAIERVEARKHQLRLSKDQLDQLKERKRTEQAAVESTFRELYASVWLPRVEEVEEDRLEIEKVERGGRPLQATGIHERIMELLTSVGTPKVHGKVTPRKIIERVKLGEVISEGEQPRLGIKTAGVLEAFFRDIAPPRLESSAVLRKGIARGVEEGVFAYTSGTFPSLGADGKFQVSRDKIVIGRPLAEDEVDFDSGFLMLPLSLPPTMEESIDAAEPEAPVAAEGEEKGPIVEDEATGTGKKMVRLSFRATRDQVFKVFPAIANLADKSDQGKITIRVEGTVMSGYDSSWFRNAVEEPLDEADVDDLEIEE